jgi:hypothetical protein
MIDTYSAFIYGHTIDNSNFYFGIDEGSGELLAELNASAYTISDFITELGRSLNEISEIGNNYNVTLDRATRVITISGDNSFSILTTSSSQLVTSAYSLAGFSGADKTGTNSYIGDDASGSIYYPQFRLQKWVDFIDQQGSQTAVLNTPANGAFTEVISYGDQQIMECEIKFATDLQLHKDSLIVQNLTGVSDLRNFMLYAITKAPIEFIYDKDDLNTFTKCILDKTPEDSKGTKFKLKEDRNWRNTYSTGLLKFRATI